MPNKKLMMIISALFKLKIKMQIFKVYMPNKKLMMIISALFKLKIKMQIFNNYNNKYKKI